MKKVSLSAQDVVKHYGGVVALSDGNLEVESGEVMAFVGANGSGKSTLGKIITGVVAPDEGKLLLDGESVSFSSPQAAKKLGLTAVYQELSLVPDMTVAENIWLAHEPMAWGVRINSRKVQKKTQELLDLFADTTQATLQPDAPVVTLPPDERQIVEILKALSQDPRLIILDEATASLDGQQVKRLFELIGEWKEQGLAIVFISHRMEEIFRVADRVTVLRNGKTVKTMPIDETDQEELVELMVGEARAAAEEIEIEAPEEARVRLKVENLETQKVHGISFDVRDGELVGIGGLQGQGQADLLLALFGAIPFSGHINISGEEVHFTHPRQAIKREVAFVPGDRAAEGLLMRRSILENLDLPSWRKYGFPLNMKKAREDARKVAEDLNLVMESLDSLVSSLSGGNAQKVVIGKWLLRNPKLLLLNDPTKGVDVGTKGEFYNLLADLRQAGTAILFYSTDDEELISLCNRVLVMHDGKIRTELRGDRLNQSELIAASLGTTAQENKNENA